MTGRASTLLLLEAGLEASRADQTEVVLTAQRLTLTRFAGAQIHQNVDGDSGTVTVRAWIGPRLGVASTMRLTPDGVRAAVRRAEDLARLASDGGEMLLLPDAARHGEVPTYVTATASCGPERRGELCAAMIERAGDLFATGNVRVALQEFAVANSRGLRAYAPLTYAAAVMVAQAPDGASGHGSAIHRDVSALDVEAVAERARSAALLARTPVSVPSGDYRVVLDPPALSLILFQLGFRGLGAFGAAAAQGEQSTAGGEPVGEGRSFVALNLGQAVAAAGFSLWDDALDPLGLPMAFDAEGVPKQRVDLIREGIAVGLCHDLTTATRAGRASTGHALPAPNHMGPVPHALVMAAGHESRSALLASLGRGLLIARCHGYVDPIDGPTGTLSGTTRDGTFLVEGGEIVAAVRNLRWTGSLPESFKTMEGASSERTLEFTDELWFPATNLLPSVRLGRFRIDGCQPHE